MSQIYVSTRRKVSVRARPSSALKSLEDYLHTLPEGALLGYVELTVKLPDGSMQTFSFSGHLQETISLDGAPDENEEGETIEFQVPDRLFGGLQVGGSSS